MSDQFEHEYSAPDEHAAELDSPQPAELSTGNEVVDGVIGSLADLADRPIDEHVGVFERAHEQLRSALDSPHED